MHTKRPKPIDITAQGYKEKQQELADLEKQRITAVADLQIAREMGDRSENAAYKSARLKLSGLDRRIRQIKSIIMRARIVEAPPEGVVGVGSVVTIEIAGTTKQYTIVGGAESDLAKGRVSQFAPLGKALMGKQAGMKAEMHAPSGSVDVQIDTIA